MKAILGIVVVGCLMQGVSFGQFFWITDYQRNGALQWTNRLCTTEPVYEVVQADSVTGPWRHVAYVTNQTSYVLSNTIPNGSSAFYQVIWTDDAPVLFEYAYDEHGIGIPSVYGQLALHLPTLTASWFFEEDPDFNTSPHPLGAGFGPIAHSPDLQTWGILLQPDLDNRVYLSGALQSAGAASGCEYVSYSGIVVWESLGGAFNIGDFLAIRQ